MSAYKLIEVVKTSEKETQSIYDREDLTTAIADMKNDFGVNVKANSTLSTYAIVIEQSTGERIDGKYWRTNDVTNDFSIRNRVYTHNDYANDNIAAYDSKQLAIGNFNIKAADSMKKAECNYALTVLIDGKGNFADCDVFHREQSQVE